MSDTSTTNVDSETTDKYLEDLKHGIPKCNTVLGIEMTRKGLAVRMDEKELKAAKATITVGAIKEYGEVSVPVKSVSLERLNEIKAAMKARQEKQEAAIERANKAAAREKLEEEK